MNRLFILEECLSFFPFFTFYPKIWDQSIRLLIMYNVHANVGNLIKSSFQSTRSQKRMAENTTSAQIHKKTNFKYNSPFQWLCVIHHSPSHVHTGQTWYKKNFNVKRRSNKINEFISSSDHIMQQQQHHNEVNQVNK